MFVFPSKIVNEIEVFLKVKRYEIEERILHGRVNDFEKYLCVTCKMFQNCFKYSLYANKIINSACNIIR